MKALANVKTTVQENKVTITADIVDRQFGLPIQQVTVGYLNPKNPRWPRHVQLSGEAVFVRAYGIGFGIMNDDLVNIAAKVEPRTSFSPKFSAMPIPGKLEVDFCSELDPELQWQQSADNKEWLDILGETGRTLDKGKAAPGSWVRCVASSAAGATATPPVKV